MLARMDSPANDEAQHAEVEHARRARVVETVAPDTALDQRPPVERLASGMGNRGFSQLVARMGDGEGILSGGLGHPDVQAAIAASRGGGQPLASSAARALE